MDTEIVIKKGGLPGCGRPKGLSPGENLYEQSQVLVPIQLQPFIKGMIAEWKKAYRSNFSTQKILDKLKNSLNN